MIFNTWTFALFALIGYAFYWLAVPARLRPHALILLGCVFYAYAFPLYLLLIGALAVVTYVAAQGLIRTRDDRQARRRFFAWLGIGASVATLVVFKYLTLIVTSVNAVLPTHLPIPKLLVPLAISFFTFEFVHLLVDTAKGKIAKLTPLPFAVFTMFFPTLVAGPIKRYEHFVPQLANIRRPEGLVVAANVYRVILGLAKKAIIADSMTPFTQPLLTPGPQYHTLDYWVAMLAYTAKIYFDFSGYSDVAIGLSALLGIEILENFDRPYWAQNIGIFWRRWHMSLSTWIRDYVFIPLGGSRGGKVRTIGNLGLGMAISGLWHGAAWHFVVWGLWHGAGLAIQRVWAQTMTPRIAARFPASTVGAVSIVVTFGFVAVGWILFASPDLGAAGAAMAGLVGWFDRMPVPGS